MTGGWQQQCYDQPAIGIAGDRASNNPFATYDVGPYGLVAGSKGVTIGNFAWTVSPDDPNGTPSIANSFGAGSVAGFVPRQQQGQNSTYLSDAGMQILAGYQMTLVTGGDFLAVNSGSGQVTRGMKAYANFLTGAVTFAAAGAPTTGASATGSSIAAETFSVTASITGAVMTVSAVGSGTIYPGATISGTNVATGSQVVSQLSGTTGGVGTYLVSIPEQTVASTTVSGTYGLLTIGTLTTTPTFAVGDTLNATGSVVAGTQITANVTGSGGTGGTMVVSNNTVVSSQTISAVGNVETPWYALNDALAGEIVKISAPVAGYGSQLS
jgi:hypothetical protein